MIDPLNVFKRYTPPIPSPSRRFTSLPRSSTISTSTMLSTLNPLPSTRHPRLLRKPSHSDLVSPWAPGTPVSPYPPHLRATGGGDGSGNAHAPLPPYSSFLALDESRRPDPAFSLAQGGKRSTEGKPPRSGGFSIDKSRTRKHSFVPPSPRWERLPTIQGVMSIVSSPSASRRPSLVSPVPGGSEGNEGLEERRRSLRGKKRTLELPIMTPPPCPSPPIPPVPPVPTAGWMTGSKGSNRSSYLTASNGNREHVSTLYRHPPSETSPHNHTDKHKDNDNPSPSLSSQDFSGTSAPQSLLSPAAASPNLSSGHISVQRTRRNARSASPLDPTPSVLGTTTDVDRESSIDFSEWDIISLHAPPPRAAWSPPSSAHYPPSPPRTSSLAHRHQLGLSTPPLDTSRHPSSVSVHSASSQGTEIDATEVLETFKSHLTEEKWDEQLAREREMLDKSEVPAKQSGGNGDNSSMAHVRAEQNPKGPYGKVLIVGNKLEHDSRSSSSPVSHPTTLPRPPQIPPRGASRPPPLNVKEKSNVPEDRADTSAPAIRSSPLSSPKKSISIRRREKRKSGPAEPKTPSAKPQEVKSGGLIRSPTFHLPIHLRPLPPLPSESNTPPKLSLLNGRFHTRLLRPKRPSTAPHPASSGSVAEAIPPETRPSLPEALLSPRFKLKARDEPPAALGKRASDIADKRKGMTAKSFLALDDPSKTLSGVSSRTSLSKETSSDDSSPSALPASSSHDRKVSAKSIDWMVRSSSPAVTHIIPPAELSKIGAEHRLKASIASRDLMDDDDEMASRVALHGSAFDVSTFERLGGEAKRRMRASLNITTTNHGEFASASQNANDRRPSDPLPPTKHRTTGPVVPPRKISHARSPRSPAAPDPRIDRSSPIKPLPKPLPLQLDELQPSTTRLGCAADSYSPNAGDIYRDIGEDFGIFTSRCEARFAKTLPPGDRPSTLGRWDSPPLTPSLSKQDLDHVELEQLPRRGESPAPVCSAASLLPLDTDGDFGTTRYGDNLGSSAEASELGDALNDKASSEWSMDVQVGIPFKHKNASMGEVRSPVSSDPAEEEALALGVA